MSNSSEGTLPLGAVLARAAGELRAQAEAVDGLHALAAALGQGGSAADAAARTAALRAGQSIDVAAQHLLALAAVIDAAAASVPPGAALSGAVLDALPLSDLAARLRGQAPAPMADDGDFELL